MTILQAIRAVDVLAPNDISAETKLRWLSEFDGQVRCDVIDTHWGPPAAPFRGYDSTTDIETTQLLIPAPYEDVYPLLLTMHVHFQNADTARFLQAAEMLTREYGSFTDWYNRTHRPRAVRSLRF